MTIETNFHVRDVDEYQRREIEDAIGVLGRYCDPVSKSPMLEVPASTLIADVQRKAELKGRPVRNEQALQTVGERFVKYRFESRIGDCSVEASTNRYGKVVPYGDPDAAQVHFVWLTPGSPLEQEGRYVAGAFWYQPDPAVMVRSQQGNLYPSPYLHGGYLGWVAFFESGDAATEAHRELCAAVVTLGTPVLDDEEPDELRQAELDEAEREEAWRARQADDLAF